MTHEFLWLKTPPGSSLKYKIVDMHGIPNYKYKIVIDIPIRDSDGLIIGTNSFLQDVLNKEVDTTVSNPSHQLVFESRHDYLILERNDQTNQVTIISRKTNTRITMESLSEKEWDHLIELSSAAKLYSKMTKVHESFLADIFKNELEGITWKRISMTLNWGTFSKIYNSVVETFTAYRSLPIEDHLILIKETLIGVTYLFGLSTLEKQHKSMIFYGLEGNIHFCAHMNQCKISSLSEPVDRCSLKIIEEFLDCLRLDPIVLHLMTCILLFNDRPGITCEDIIESERQVFKGILEKYIDAKIKAGHFIEDKQVLLENVDSIIKQCMELEKVFTQYSCALHRSLIINSSSPVRHDSIMVRRSPGSDIEFRLLRMTVHPALNLVMEIELTIKDGIVEGTNYSLEDLVNESSEVIEISSSTESVISIEGPEGNKITLQRLPSNVSPENSHFNVLILDSRSKIASIMTDFTEEHWSVLNQVLSMKKVLSELSSGKGNLLTVEDEIETDYSRSYRKIIIERNWIMADKIFIRAFQMLDIFRELSCDDQTLLRKEAMTEVLFCQHAVNYDRENNFIINYYLRKTLCIYVHIRVFKEFENVTQQLTSLMEDFYDFVRKDPVVVGIMSVLLLLQERPGFTRYHTILQQRVLVMNILDKYIRAKTTSGVWALPVDVIWQHIHRKMGQLSQLKIFFEQTKVSNLNLDPSFNVSDSSHVK